MKTVIRRLLGMLLFGVLTFFGVMDINAANSAKSQSSKTISNLEIQITQKTELKLAEVSTLKAKKLDVEIFVKSDKISPEKVDKKNVTNKTIKKTGTSPASPRVRQSEGCFTSCLERSANPDVVLTCASACSNGEYLTYALCVGVGVAVVLGCANECIPLLD